MKKAIFSPKIVFTTIWSGLHKLCTYLLEIFATHVIVFLKFCTPWLFQAISLSQTKKDERDKISLAYMFLFVTIPNGPSYLERLGKTS